MIHFEVQNVDKTPISHYARAGMLRLRRSLSRQSNPSTLTAGLLPKFARTQLPLRGEWVEVEAVGIARGETGVHRSSPNRES